MENAKSHALEVSATSKVESDNRSASLLDSTGERMHLHDGAASSRDVMIALTYGLDLVRNGAMLVASEGYPQLANRAALAILEKKRWAELGENRAGSRPGVGHALTA